MNPSAAKRIALYARVSTSKCDKCGKRQSDHEALDHEYRGQDSEVQLRELREYDLLLEFLFGQLAGFVQPKQRIFGG